MKIINACGKEKEYELIVDDVSIACGVVCGFACVNWIAGAVIAHMIVNY